MINKLFGVWQEQEQEQEQHEEGAAGARAREGRSLNPPPLAGRSGMTAQVWGGEGFLPPLEDVLDR